MKKSIPGLVGAAFVLVAACWPALAGTPVSTSAPEPSTILLVAGAGGALLAIRHLRKKR